jgi:hypothetical protein
LDSRAAAALELAFVALIIFLNNATKGGGVRLGSQLVASSRPDLEDELLSSMTHLLVAPGCGGGWKNGAALVSHWRNSMPTVGHGWWCVTSVTMVWHGGVALLPVHLGELGRMCDSVAVHAGQRRFGR